MAELAAAWCAHDLLLVAHDLTLEGAQRGRLVGRTRRAVRTQDLEARDEVEDRGLGGGVGAECPQRCRVGEREPRLTVDQPNLVVHTVDEAGEALPFGALG